MPLEPQAMKTLNSKTQCKRQNRRNRQHGPRTTFRFPHHGIAAASFPKGYIGARPQY